MITFYFVRHGETEMNANGVLQGFVDSNLTEKGVQESIKLGEYLADNVVFNHVFCSPLGRCKTTCDLILSAYDQEFDVVYDERIMEFNFGPFDGQVYSKAKMKHPEIIKNLFDNRVNIFHKEMVKHTITLLEESMTSYWRKKERSVGMEIRMFLWSVTVV